MNKKSIQRTKNLRGKKKMSTAHAVMKPMKGVIEAHQYVERHIRFIGMDRLKTGDLQSFLSCIDGRERITAGVLGALDTTGGRISFPGGGVGILTLILSAINDPFIESWVQDNDPRAETAKESFSFGVIAGYMERILGGMSGHTDEHSMGSDLACAGCGHAKALLSGGYGLGDIYRADLAAYLRELKKRAARGEEGITIDVYHGDHVESAALRLKCNLELGEFLSIIPNDGTMSVFVFSEHMALRLLNQIAGVLYEEMRSEFKKHGLSKEEFLSKVDSQYYSHVRLSAYKLARGKPVYDVNHIGKGQVEVRESELLY